MKNLEDINIGDHSIGGGRPPLIIAELSANHNGDLSTALKTIEAAKSHGADAIKLQTYSADTMTIDCDAQDFLINEGTWAGYKLYDLYKEAQTPFSWHRAMFDKAREIGITCFSTPFDESAVDLLEDIGVPAYKVASFEATDLPLIRYIAETKKPMIVSTGMASLPEIEELVQTVRDGGCANLILLHCISAYPAPSEESNLHTIQDLQARFNVHVGLSDHTVTNAASVVATALGAVLIEKHFILDRSMGGPDSSFSIEPNELAHLKAATSEAYSTLGKAGYERKKAEASNVVFRRSLYFVESLKAGEKVTSESVRRIRPGYGLAPKYEGKVIGSTLSRNVNRGEPVRYEDLENPTFELN